VRCVRQSLDQEEAAEQKYYAWYEDPEDMGSERHTADPLQDGAVSPNCRISLLTKPSQTMWRLLIPEEACIDLSQENAGSCLVTGVAFEIRDRVNGREETDDHEHHAERPVAPGHLLVEGDYRDQRGCYKQRIICRGRSCGLSLTCMCSQFDVIVPQHVLLKLVAFGELLALVALRKTVCCVIH
jgi:hypothetical protein